MIFIEYILKEHDAKLLFTDTDSLFYEIKTDDVYEDFYKDKHLFDLSNNSKGLKLFEPDNEKVIGKVKDDSKGKINDAFVGLKSKMHSMRHVNSKKDKTGKGVNSNNIENKNHGENFDTLFNKKVVRHKTKRIQSQLHKVRTYDVSKISLSCFDNNNNNNNNNNNIYIYIY